MFELQEILSRADFVDELIKLWRESVIASHDFLTADDVVKLEPFVAAAITNVETLIVAREKISVAGFMGVADKKIEMLFVAPKFFGHGLGRKFVELAVEKYRVQFVDCNEQNPAALNFYRRLGFEIFGRQKFDAQGNRFPILHLRR